jgi:hypothetical protein
VRMKTPPFFPILYLLLAVYTCGLYSQRAFFGL